MPINNGYTDSRARAAMLPEIDVPNRQLIGALGNATVDWGATTLKSLAGTTMVVWNGTYSMYADIIFGTDNVYNIGSVLANRPASLHLSQSATLGGLTASRAVVSDGSKVLTSSATTATEIGYVNGVTSSIQTQLDSKAPNNNPLMVQVFS